jgi:hypothetical protein
MSLGATFALAHDALVIRTSEGVVTDAPPSPFASPPAVPLAAPPAAPLAAPEPAPPVPASGPVVTSAADVDAAVAEPALPPNPYEPHEI